MPLATGLLTCVSVDSGSKQPCLMGVYIVMSLIPPRSDSMHYSLTQAHLADSFPL